MNELSTGPARQKGQARANERLARGQATLLKRSSRPLKKAAPRADAGFAHAGALPPLGAVRRRVFIPAWPANSA